MAGWVIIAIIVLLAVRTPLFVAIGGAAMLSFALFVPGYETFADLQVIAREITVLTDKNVLLAIPFFVLSAAIMTAGGIATRLVNVAQVFVGHLRGGLAISSVLACMFFGAISGSSPVTLIAVGSIMFPGMMLARYRENFSLGLLTTAGSLGCLIPPSIPMLVYAVSVPGGASVDLRELYLAGAGPAVLIALSLCVYSYFSCPKGSTRPKASWTERRAVLREATWALLLPVIIWGGIYTGFFTATEASAVSVVYALVVELFIHRELEWAKIPSALLKSVTMMGALLLIIALSFALNALMTELQFAERMLEWIREQNMSAVGFMLAINLFLVLTGCLMDSLSAIILFTPLIAPTAVALGIDPLHLGVVFIINMEIGYVAPPIATNLFVTAQLFQKPFGQVVRAVMPTLAILTVGLFAVTYVPSFAIGPVYALRGGSLIQPFGSYAKSTAGPGAGPGPSGTEKRVLSIEEMMKKARQPTTE